MKFWQYTGVLRKLPAILCIITLLASDSPALSPSPQTAAQTTPQVTVAKFPPEQLGSLVAPIAVYPDPLLAQVLAASTYPLEIIQLQQWLERNKNLKDKALADAVAKELWDPSVQALAALPEVVNRLANDIKWTTDLGNAFLAQESDVMDAVQQMRKKALDKGTIASSEQQKVETRVIENKSVIVIEPTNPEVVYVPSYDPVVVYGPAYYPYPSIYYPSWGYYAGGLALSFGVGVMMGAFWSGGWGWGCGWGGNNIYINNNNNFNRGNINRGNLGNRGNRPSQLPARSNWQHRPEHRGGAPYGDRATADRFGGSARGDSLARRQSSARQQIGRQGGNLASFRSGNGGGIGNRVGGASGGAGFSNRAGSTGLSRSGVGGADRIGSRDLTRSGGGNRDAFGGGTRGYDGSNAHSSSTRGASSLGSRGGGGFSRGGGFRGGGGRRR